MFTRLSERDFDDMLDLTHWAQYLLDAATGGYAVEPITTTTPLSVDDAYLIQEAWLSKRLERGERLVGAKLGLTSRAKQEQMRVSEPAFAWLTDQMQHPWQDDLSLGGLIHPRVEPEICLVANEKITGPGVTATDVVDRCSVHAGLEVIDSRFKDFRFTLPDVIADDASSSLFVLGRESIDGRSTDLSAIRCEFLVDGEVVSSAVGAAIMGSPAEAVALMANKLSERGYAIEPGWIILAGALTEAVPVRPGMRIEARYSDGLGTVGVRAIS